MSKARQLIISYGRKRLFEKREIKHNSCVLPDSVPNAINMVMMT
jgi:hypothetical protein